jgi:hypothetical protein
MCPGNPSAVVVLTGDSVRFGARHGQKPDLVCLGGFVTRTGHRTEGICPGLEPDCGSKYTVPTPLSPIKYVSFNRIMI